MPLIVYFLDVGQGDSALVILPDKKTMLIDCGSSKSGNKGAIAVSAIRRALKIDAPTPIVIDMLVLTHGDKDHYNLLKNLSATKNGSITFKETIWGCDAELYKNATEKNWTYKYLSKTAKNSAQTKIQKGYYFSPKAEWSHPGPNGQAANIWILAANLVAPKISFAKKNENSVVIMIEYWGHRIFLMGDATEATEKAIMLAYQKIKPSPLTADATKFTVLKAGHHGSSTSSCTPWLKAVEPDVVMISSDTFSFGSNGRGLPDGDKIAQLQTDCALWTFSPSKITPGSKADLKHSLAYFNSDKTPGRFETMNMGLTALCSTIAKATSKIETAADGTKKGVVTDAIGCTWSVDVKDDGSGVLFGWTGLEDTMSPIFWEAAKP